MAPPLDRVLLAAAAVACVAASAATSKAHSGSLRRARGGLLERSGEGQRDTPVTRVVGLLKEMSKTLGKEMEEDEALYKELACWCNNGDYEKTEAIEASTAKVSELEASIGSLSASSGELKATIQELENELASDKKALAEATALREKQAAEFHSMELDSVQNLENLKAAIVVLSKHHAAPPESTVAGGAIFKSERDSWSLLALGSKELPWTAAHEASRSARSFDNFLRRNGFHEESASSASARDGAVASDRPAAPHKFLQQGALAGGEAAAEGWSAEDAALVRRALKSASAFVQAHAGTSYYPAYNSQSGEIMGVLKQLKEEMEGELSEAQKEETARAAAFEELRAAKTSEIESGEKMAEQKEDELANTDNSLAEAKEDLGQEQNVLAESQKFLKNLKETCAEASKNFEARKKARMAEMQAVSEAIEILQGDEARDAMSGTFSFVQLDSDRQHHGRQEAAATLRLAARRTHSPQLSILATSVELDAFAKVKKAIDNMIAMLKVQQEDEVKKNDWCKAELHENELGTSRAEATKADLEAKVAELASNIKGLEDGIADAQAQIAQMQLDLQRASEDRQKENLDFQKTVADQTMTVEVLKEALERLAKYYDFLQQHSMASTAARQTPPVPQMEYKPSKGASGVMEMIEKLIYDAKELMADSKHAESEAQAAYEQTIADTNGSVAALQKEIVSKTQAKGMAKKDKMAAESDLADTVGELEGLAKYNGEVHAECDYLLKNFDVRQSGRAQEIEALQQAKQILSGATLS